jgi:hypothetical protein
MAGYTTTNKVIEILKEKTCGLKEQVVQVNLRFMNVAFVLAMKTVLLQ